MSDDTYFVYIDSGFATSQAESEDEAINEALSYFIEQLQRRLDGDRDAIEFMVERE